MNDLRTETWDNGKLTVNTRFAEMLRANALDTYDALMHSELGEFAKNLRRDRQTLRVALDVPGDGPRDFFLKRHRGAPFKEYIKPWLRLTRPIIGARNEWQAIQHFEHAGIPTMQPVALGENGCDSFLLTEGIAGCRKLSEWIDECAPTEAGLNAVVNAIAHTARRMHAAGLHHQDFYLGHLLLPLDDESRGLHVIDLGRARRCRRLSNRWIVKDLAQLLYSARQLPDRTRQRFLETYFEGTPKIERPRLIRRIDRKAERIARHSRKRKL